MPLRITPGPGTGGGGAETDPVAEADLATHKTDAAAHSQLDARYQPLDSDLTALAALSTTSYGRAFTALADAAAAKTALSLVKGDVGLGSVDNTADTAKPVSTAQQAALDAITGVYRVLARSSGRGTTVAASGSKYLLAGTAAADTTSLTSNVQNATALVPVVYYAADYAISGKATKLRLRALLGLSGVAPGVTITVGLYPLVNTTGSWSLGTLVTGSTVAFASPAAAGTPDANSGDFTPPADGLYLVGYEVSGTPGGNFDIHATLQVRNV